VRDFNNVELVGGQTIYRQGEDSTSIICSEVTRFANPATMSACIFIAKGTNVSLAPMSHSVRQSALGALSTFVPQDIIIVANTGKYSRVRVTAIS
jgi:hypothetical protein